MSDRGGGIVAGYRDHDRMRWVAERPKDSRRGEFARDRARVVHSAGLRRLAAKTQVVGPGTDDFVRNRLTHSLEVAQIGRELGSVLGCDPDVVETACLAHDLGHPPFGHTGELALDDVAAPWGGFEGNAQTLRVLTRLEPKVMDAATGRSAGLNLTRASLDAVIKYPWIRGQGPSGKPRSKFGAYPDDLAVFRWVRTGAQDSRCCVEAQVMDLSDDVAYCVHDVEDAIVAGRLDPRVLDVPGQLARVSAQVRSWYLTDVTDDEVVAALQRLRSLPAWVGEYDAGHRALAALKDMTSQLIGRFSRAVALATRERFGDGPLIRYAADVVAPRETLVEIAALKGVAAVYVMIASDRQELYQRQREVLADLVGYLIARAPDDLEPWFAAAWNDAQDDAGRVRAVIDQVASLTDSSAVTWHARLLPPPHS